LLSGLGALDSAPAHADGTTQLGDIGFRPDGVLYGIGRDGALFTVNITTGRLTIVGFPAVGGSLRGNGLTFAPLSSTPSTLYWSPKDSDGSLRVLNQATGAVVSSVVMHGTGNTINALTTDAAQTTLLGVDSDRAGVATTNLIAINPTTGDVTTRGPLPDDTDALAFSPISTLLYAATGSNSVDATLYTVNPADGTTVPVGAVLVGLDPIGLTGLAFHPTTGTLYGVTTPNSSNLPLALVTINPATAQAAVIGDLTVVATLVTTTSPQTYTEGNGAKVIDPGLIVLDPDSPTLTVATVSITGNFHSGEDVLGFTNQNGITGSYNSATGVLTLSGIADQFDYETALESVTYTNSSSTPSTATRTITFVASDEAGAGPPATRQITITALPDPSIIITSASALSYTEGDGAKAIDPALTVTDNDSLNLAGATVSIAGSFQSAQDSLGFAAQNGITGSYNSATGVLTLTGTATLANYQAALRSVTYTNGSDAPTPATRTIAFQVTDDAALQSIAAPRTVTLTPTNDPPVNTLPVAQTTPANQPLVFSQANGNAISIADPDAGGGDMQVTLNVSSGTLTAGPGATVPPLTSVTGNGTATLTLAGRLVDLNVALQGLTLTPASGFAGPITLTMTTNDQGSTPAPALQDVDTVQVTVGGLPALSIDDVSLPEGTSGSTNATFTVTLSQSSSLPVTVQAATADGSAQAGSDYTPVGPTTLTFPPGTTAQTFSVPVLGDTTVEPTETFVVTLTGPTNATIGRPQGVGTVVNDDDATVIFPNDVSVAEGNSGPTTATFTVSLNRATTSPVTVQFATADGTATTGDHDYQAASGTLTFNPGETSKAVAISVTGDTRGEGNETFLLTIFNPSGAAIARAQGVGTIVDDDPITAPSACSPRPAVAVTSQPTGDGRLQVTVAAGTQAPNVANRLTELRFQAGTNALIDVAGENGRSGAFSVSLPARPASVTFFVRRAAPDQATSLSFVVVDDCGAWPAFVGGGPSAF